MRRTAPTLTMSRSRHRWRLQDFRPAAMFLMIEKEDLLKAGVDDSGENEKAEKALTRSPEDCHLRLLSKPNHRSCVIPFTMRLYPLMPVLNMSQEGDERFVYTAPLEVDYKERTKVANPFALQSQRLHPRWRSVCACADFLRTDSVRGVLPLDEREPGSCALTRAAAWTTVLPGPARDHHGPEDPVEEAGHRDDQDQDDPGELRHRHLLSPRGGNEVCIKCIESFCCHHFNIVTISVFSLKQDLQTTLRRCCLILVAKATTVMVICDV